MSLQINKSEVYNILKELNYKVMQSGNNVFATFPTITFREDINTPEYTLNKEIGLQRINYVIDIWSLSSTEATQITKEVEEKLRQNDYYLQYKVEVGQEDEIFHISMRFEKII